MELKEISATTLSPYRCYIRGNILQSEGENVHTIGFKDGLAVVKYIQPAGSTDMQKMRDNMLDSKAIDLSKLKKIIVKVDPLTGKKYIIKDGKKIEILPQITNPSVLNFAPKLTPPKPPLVIKKAPVLDKNVTMRVLDNVKYHVLSMNVKKGTSSRSVAVATMTDRDLAPTSDKNPQTDCLDRKDRCTQTEPLTSCGRDSPFSDLLSFVLGDSDGRESSDLSPKKMIDPNMLKAKEDMDRFNFFNDMRRALKFDRSGNLPIHESVMQNNIKSVRKNCVVLQAIRETVNIPNQQGYTPLHLAILHDIGGAIIQTLLDHGADLNVADSEGNTAFHLAIESGRSGILKDLVTWASESVDSNFNFNVVNHEGFTPLMIAVLNRSHADAKLLLQHGADPNMKDQKSGRTALFHAAECFDVALVELLMEYKADTKIRNFFGTSPHDAMFEVEDMPLQIKLCILGKDHQRFQNKRKIEGKSELQPLKKAKLETTPVLKRVNANEIIIKPKRK